MRAPIAPGTAYVLLHHSFGEVNGKKGVWGTGAITQAMAKTAAVHGVDIRLYGTGPRYSKLGGRARRL
jgi:phytoene dehydrogenase-like protein